MPQYRITTTTTLYLDDPTAEFEPGAEPAVTATTVDSLDEARTWIAQRFTRRTAAIAVSRGTDLAIAPDGTIIEVRPA